MRIAIVNITSGGMSGGYRTYLENVVPRVASHPQVSSVLVAVPETVHLACEANVSSRAEWFAFTPSVRSTTTEDVRIQSRIEAFRPDVIFIPTARYHGQRSVPSVTMIRNMEPLVCPYSGNPLGEKARNWLRIWHARTAIRRAARVIAVSEFVRDFLVSEWRVPSEKVGVVYHGGVVDTAGKLTAKPRTVPQEWDGRFVFTAGSIRPARGLEDIIQAVGMLSRSEGVRGLVIAGYTEPRMERYHRQLCTLAGKFVPDVPVIWTGSLPREEMGWCYNHCSVFAMTSRVESFGVIAVEAMSHGCLCIAADNPSLPEVFGQTVRFYPPRNPKALAGEIHKVLGLDPSSKQRMMLDATQRASFFNWDRCAESTVMELSRAILDVRR